MRVFSGSSSSNQQKVWLFFFQIFRPVCVSARRRHIWVCQWEWKCGVSPVPHLLIVILNYKIFLPLSGFIEIFQKVHNEGLSECVDQSKYEGFSGSSNFHHMKSYHMKSLLSCLRWAVRDRTQGSAQCSICRGRGGEIPLKCLSTPQVCIDLPPKKWKKVKIIQKLMCCWPPTPLKPHGGGSPQRRAYGNIYRICILCIMFLFRLFIVNCKRRVFKLVYFVMNLN